MTSWIRRLWGVEFSGKLTRPHLIGSLWAARASTYHEEPTRALLFCTRKQAREWCKSKNQCCADWRFRPVRVVETVKKT